jgi:hypothetical protein
MTFIQPKKSLNILNCAIAVCAVLCVLGTFLLIALYNNVINVNHNIAAVKSELDAVGAANTSLNDKIVASLGIGVAVAAAQGDGLVQEKTPQYFQTNQQWAFASQP